MAKGFKHGGGSGTGLNFKVVAYPSEEVLPDTASGNTIAVFTDTPITSYAFSPTELTSPTEGMVWITTGTSSAVAFNALKKNVLTICPLSAKQYIGGAWVDVTAKSYQGGKWVDWVADIVIYDSGATDIALTLANAKDSGAYLTLTLDLNGNATVKSALIDLSRQTRLEVTYSSLGGDGSFAGGIRARAWDKSGDVVAESSRSTAESGTLTLDISALSGEYMVGVYANNTSGSYAGSCRVSAIKTLMS